MLARCMRAIDARDIGDWLAFVPAEITEGWPSMATPEGQALADQAAEMHEAELVVVDNLSTLARSEDENDSATWANGAQSWVVRQRLFGRAVLLVHHSGKAGAQRGTSAREDVLDTVINLRLPEGSEGGDGLKARLRWEKTRDLGAGVVRPLELELVDVGGFEEWRFTETVSERELLREDALALQAEGLTQREIAKRLSVSLGTVNKLLRA